MQQIQQGMGKLKQIMNAAQFANDPISATKAALDAAVSKNPMLGTILTAANGDYQKAFYQYAQQIGVSPELVFNAMKQM